MNRTHLIGAALLLVLLAASAAAWGQEGPARPTAPPTTPVTTPATTPVTILAPAPYKAARTPWGDPDLRGMWPVDSVGQTPRQRAVALGTRAQLTEEEYQAALKVARDGLSLGDRQDKAGILGMGHWAERGLPLRQTSLIVEPANGRYPPLTAAGQAAAAAERPAGTTPRSTRWTISEFSTAASRAGCRGRCCPAITTAASRSCKPPACWRSGWR